MAALALAPWPFSAGAAWAGEIPNLVGTWKGTTNTIGPEKGLKSRERTVHITEQTDRRFRGYFDYEEGRKDVFGVIFPDDTTFAWVTPTSKGYSHGRILAPDHIASCYVESGEHATAGCSDLKRTDTKP